MAGMTKQQMAEVRTYKVYQHTLPDGSAYIGLTSEERLYDRFQYRCGYDKQPFGEAAAEWGWKNVTTTILETIVDNQYIAHDREKYWIQDALDKGIKLYNSNHAKQKISKNYKREGVTLTNINRYFETFAAAARYIGVTIPAICSALERGRPCKGYDLAYGNQTKGEEENA